MHGQQNIIKGQHKFLSIDLQNFFVLVISKYLDSLSYRDLAQEFYSRQHQIELIFLISASYVPICSYPTHYFKGHKALTPLQG